MSYRKVRALRARLAVLEEIAKDATLLRVAEMKDGGGGVFDFTVVPDHAAREAILDRLIDTTG